MIVTRGVWKIPATILTAIVIGEALRNYIVTEDARPLFAIVLLVLLYVGAKAVMYYDKERKEVQ